MDRLVSVSVLCGCLLVLLVVAGSAVGTAATGPAVESVSASVTGEEADENNSTTASDNVTEIGPASENVSVPVEDAEPFEFGTTVIVQEETLQSVTFRADESDIEGNLSVRQNDSTTADDVGENRTVHNSIDLTVPASATDVPATLRLVVEAHPVEHRENLEVMRHTNGEWEPLETEILSNRTWSSDRGASVMLLEAETSGFSTFAVTETNETETDSEAEEVDQEAVEADNETTFAPPAEADIYRITDRRPFEFGKHVHIHEETVREITFQNDSDAIDGFVAINESNASAVSELREQRSVIRALDITASENASQTPATLHLAVRASALENRDDVELMRYNADGEAWESLETEVVSERYWSTDHDASVFDVEAETPGFSTFAVTEAPEDDHSDDSEADSEPDPASEQSAEEESADDGGLLFGFGLVEIAIVVIVLAGGTGAVVVVRRR